ncbi:helix-turn-helix domain-containing protein [Rathayibacter sp. VKM Ac-2856]|uniref:helix-turn-helix transcriptional regulator n=1 Tax=unclassified Rathayibacter TaxID=2609250 RepID=UPI0015632FD8|nr:MULTISPECIES: helix-turn-helix domain-containing protein [unclassified Rathayibacter]NQX04681.1 helix-turn-helix domain-containing protein [Rathayibacter sp. VKM Ac-2858]NQX19849.1 helix-turn-helix domain-containing protein [Rathayibacter sp. VKM Ac-2856]
MGRTAISLNPVAGDALRLLGAQVRIARHARRWSSAELAARAGVSVPTVLALETGKPSVSIGNALNIAVLAGVDLFGITDPVELARARKRGEDRVALLPAKTYMPREGADGDFDF